jgi:hypothetical protein
VSVVSRHPSQIDYWGPQFQHVFLFTSRSAPFHFRRFPAQPQLFPTIGIWPRQEHAEIRPVELSGGSEVHLGQATIARRQPQLTFVPGGSGQVCAPEGIEGARERWRRR